MNYHFILTNGRSGSNYLVNTLNLHPEITNYGEVLGKWTLPYKLYYAFSNKASVDQYLDFIYQSQLFFTLAQFYSAFSKLKKRQQPNLKLFKSIKTLGIKDFYINLKKLQIESYLIEHSNIKVINLYRENQLKRLISCLFLQNTQVVAKDNQSQQPKKHQSKLTLPIDELIPTLDIYEQEVVYQSQLANRLEENRVLHIKYEDYFQSPESIDHHNDLIYQFLGVKPIASKSRHQKILSNRWEDSVANYQEVRQTLENTKYAKYL